MRKKFGLFFSLEIDQKNLFIQYVGGCKEFFAHEGGHDDQCTIRRFFLGRNSRITGNSEGESLKNRNLRQGKFTKKLHLWGGKIQQKIFSLRQAVFNSISFIIYQYVALPSGQHFFLIIQP